jgi:hypothetical protein
MKTALKLLAWALASTLPDIAQAQELEPRRWGHLPTGSNFAGAGYIFTDGDIALDPVLQIDDATVRMHTYAAKYIHTFELFDKSARFDWTQGYQDAIWEGQLGGQAASTSRSGWSDTLFRFAMNLVGGPPLKGQEFADYRAGLDRETIVGAGLVLVLPTGDYYDDKLLNLGDNRFSIRPQLGVVHARDQWSFEFTGSTWFFTENDEFWNGNSLEVDPLVSLQAHLVYTISPGLWIGTGIGQDFGAQSTLNGIEKDDRKSNLSFGITMGIPINRSFGFKVGYIGTRTQEKVGADLDNLVFGASLLW